MKIAVVKVESVSDMFRQMGKLIESNENDQDFYIFPSAARKCEGSLAQALKVHSESWELLGACKDKSYDKVLDEAMDVIHAVETLLRWIGATDNDLQASMERVVKKNAERGYYGGE